MRKAAVAEPEFFVEPRRIDDEGVAFPSPSRVPVIQGIVVVAAQLARLGASVGVDEMPIVIAAAGHDENPAEGLVFQKLIPVRHLKLPHRARRDALEKDRIAIQEIALPELVERARPRLERRDLAAVFEILQQPVAVHRHIGAGFHQHGGARPGPVSRFTRHGPQARLAVGPAWNGQGALIARGRFQRRQGFRRHRQYSLFRTRQHDRVSPDLPAPVAGEDALHGDGIARVERIHVPAAALQVHRTLDFDRPIHRFARPLTTFIRTCTCGLAQSTLVTCPTSVVDLAGSNFAVIA